MKLELLRPNNEKNECEMDFMHRIFKLIKSNTESGSLKRKLEENSEDSHQAKYKRINNEFPKIIDNNFASDIQVLKPSPTTKAFKTENKKSSIISIANNKSFADIEFSDEEQDIFQSNGPTSTIHNNLQNKSDAKQNDHVSIRKNFPFLNISQKFRNKFGWNKQDVPPLIEARTGNITTTREIPHLISIRKSASPQQLNGYNFLNPPIKNENQIQMNSFNPFNVNLSTSRNSCKYINDLPRLQNMDVHKNKKSNIFNRPSAILNKIYNFQDKKSYEDLLKNCAPNVYDSGYAFGQELSELSKVKSPTARKSINNLKLNLVNTDQKEKEINKNLQGNRYLTDFEEAQAAVVSPKKEILPSVKPVNTLKEKNELSPINNPLWLAQFNEKFEKKLKERNQQIKEATEEAKKYSEETEKAQRLINQKLKNILISAETIFVDEEEEEEEIEFPELTDEDDQLIRRAVYGRNLDEVLIEKFNISIKRRDIQTLVGDSWLNDEVINFYMNLLIERGNLRSSEGYPKAYAMNTFFIPRLSSAGHSGVRRWTKKIDIFSHDIIAVPVHVGGVHWCMAIIDLKNKKIEYYDSMGTPNPRVLQLLEQYLRDEHQDKKGAPFDTSNFTKESVSSCPRQMNGSDCGVFSCMFAEYLCRNKPITFSQQHMQYFRSKMILEIVKGKLLL